MLFIDASLPDLQFGVRVEGAAVGKPCVLEASSAIGPAAAWTPLFTNPSPSGPFTFVDSNVKRTEHPRKFYRAYQP